MHNIIVSAASPRVREQEQRGSSPCGQALNAAASRNRVKLYGCSVLCARTRFRKARYRQKNKMKSRAKTRTRRFIGLHSFRYFFGIHTFSQRAFYPFLPCQTRISVFYVHTSFVAALKGRIYWHSSFRSCFNKIIYIYLYVECVNISLKSRFQISEYKRQVKMLIEAQLWLNYKQLNDWIFRRNVKFLPLYNGRKKKMNSDGDKRECVLKTFLNNIFVSNFQVPLI